MQFRFLHCFEKHAYAFSHSYASPIYALISICEGLGLDLVRHTASRHMFRVIWGGAPFALPFCLEFSSHFLYSLERIIDFLSHFTYELTIKLKELDNREENKGSWLSLVSYYWNAMNPFF